MALTIEIINKRLKAIQNKYNLYILGDDIVESKTTLIFQDKDGNERSELQKEAFMESIESDNYRELIKEYSKIFVIKNKNERYFIYTKKRLHPILDFYAGLSNINKIENIIFETAEKYNTILEQGYVTGQVEFPSGNIIFSNFFKNENGYAFPVPDDLEYIEINSINHSLGEQNTMKILSETHGLGYVQLGNTSAKIYKIDNDNIIITNTYFEDYNDNEDKYSEINITAPNNWKELGEICCDVWRVEFIDQVNFDKGDPSPYPIDHKNYKYNPPFRGKVNPGLWEVKNYYHFIDDDKEIRAGRIPIWVEMTRIK